MLLTQKFNCRNMQNGDLVSLAASCVIGCPEMSVRNSQYLLHKNPEECSFLLFSVHLFQVGEWTKVEGRICCVGVECNMDVR